MNNALFKIGRTIYVTWRALQDECGVPYDTIKCWKFKKAHPSDKRVKIFIYDDLAPKYQELVKKYLTSGYEPSVFLRKQVEEELQDGFNDAKDGLVLYISSDAEDINFYHSQSLFEDSECEQLARAWAWLKFLLKIKGKKQAQEFGFASKSDLIKAATEVIKSENLYGLNISHPGTLRRWMTKAKTHGRKALISKHHGKAKYKKITDEISEWLIAQYAQPVKGRNTKRLHFNYLVEAKKRNWPDLTEQAIYIHLHKPENEKKWLLGRHGKQEWLKTFGRTLKLELPTTRDVMWNSDGTKLDWYYKPENGNSGKKASLKFYIVVDVATEVILGWDIDRTEDFVTQYRAAKMALKMSGHKPQEWIYDKQSGHTSGDSQDFLDRVVLNNHYNSRPRRSSGKPIEQMINRFQQQCVMMYWFCDGQGIKTKKQDSHPNLEFINANLDRLPTKDKLIKLFSREVKQWNNSKHPHHDQTRIELYNSQTNPNSEELSLLDQIDFFWLNTKRPIQYTKNGIRMEVKGERYWFEVYDDKGNLDLEFREKYVSLKPTKFFVKYDPDDLTRVMLYEKVNDKYISRGIAVNPTKVKRATVEQTEADKAKAWKELHASDQELRNYEEELEQIRNKTGVKPDQVITEAESIIQQAVFASKDDLEVAEAIYSEGDGDMEDITNPWDMV